tara:strand:- start:10582 stop:10848 length:267 start_codon:yes stop_codon:yes gene_type:complete
MAKLPDSYPIGDKNLLNVERLVEIIEDIYRELAIAINKKPDIIQRITDGQTSDTFLSNGDININTSTLNVEILTEHTDPANVIWTQIS